MRRRVALTVVAALLALAASGCSTVRQAGAWDGQSTPAAGANQAAGSASPSPSPSQTAYNVAPLIDPANKYVGLEIPGAPDSITPARQFAGWVGKAPNLLGNYIAWGTGFDAQAARNAWSFGALYFMVWEPWTVSCAQIAAGQSDSYITSVATAIRALNIPIALSFGHEMNGNWYPWGTNDTTAAQFVAAWRHIHDLFVQAGATNVIWVWDPNDIYPMPNVPLGPLYPGDAYVNWVGITGYWTQNGPNTFDTLYLPTIDQIRQFTQEPILIAETSVEPGSNEVNSVNALFQTVLDNPYIIGFVWYDYNDGGDWRLENRPDVEAAFASDVANPAFGFNPAQLP